jgi:chromosomal replication initiator protein
VTLIGEFAGILLGSEIVNIFSLSRFDKDASELRIGLFTVSNGNRNSVFHQNKTSTTSSHNSSATLSSFSGFSDLLRDRRARGSRQDVSALITDNGRQVVESLQSRIGRQRFELWFTPPHGLVIEDGRIRVLAGDAFSLDRIRAQFDEELKRLVREHPQLLRDVVYEVAQNTKTTSEPSTPKACVGESIAPKAAMPLPAPERNGVAPIGADPFAGFHFGPANLLAENAFRQASVSLGEISPLFLHGPVGCGKSSLLSRLVDAWRIPGKRRRGMYVSAEQFTSHFVEALKGRGLPVFRRKYRELELLALDDVQFFKNKRATLVELQSTVDFFLRERKQIVLAADRPPNELGFLAPELANRMTSGLVCRLSYPSADGRLEIMKTECTARSLPVSDKHLRMIAQRLSGDVRQLCGVMHRLYAAQLARIELQEWSAFQELLADIFESHQRPVSIESIERAVCDVCGVVAADLRSAKRNKRISAARNLAMWLARKYTGNAFSEIGMHYGGRSHSTVISAQHKVTRWLRSGETIPLASASQCPAVDAIERIEAKLRTG